MERGCVEDQPQSLACMLRLVLRTQSRSENWNHDTAIGKATSQFVVASSLRLEIWHAAPTLPRLNQDTANGNPPVPAKVVTQSRFAKKILRSKLVRDYSLE